MVITENMGCHRVFRVASVHDRNQAVCLGYTTEAVEIKGRKIPDYDVIHMCTAKPQEEKDEKTCVFSQMFSMTPQEADMLAQKLILTSGLWRVATEEKKGG